jgi:hypothetical protein
MEFVFERNTTYLSGVSTGEMLNSFKIGLYRRMEETRVSPGRKPSLLEESVAHCFPVRIELVCERNTCCLSAFTIGRIFHFKNNVLFR